MTVTIAIVDDEAIIRDSFSQLLRTKGYLTESFASAESFLDSDIIRRAQLLIIDFRLAGMSGVELLLRLRKQGHKTPVILLSGDLDAGALGYAEGIANVSFLEKPCQPPRFFDIVDRSLRASGDAETHPQA